ncbi:nitrite reductase/ring-hydroxylating ferredoxin subunit [Pseudomonas sp. TE12234]
MPASGPAHSTSKLPGLTPSRASHTQGDWVPTQNSAMFRFEDGHCIDGPCKGAQLEAVPVRWVGNCLVMEVGEEG